MVVGVEGGLPPQMVNIYSAVPLKHTHVHTRAHTQTDRPQLA